MNRLLFLVTALSALLFTDLALAQSWPELSAQQQRQLADFQSIWAQLPDNRKARLVGSTEQISRMSPVNRRRLVDSITQAAEGNNSSSEERESPTPPQQR